MTGADGVNTLLADIATLTADVQAAINAGEWLKAAQVDAERRAALRELFGCLSAEPARAARFEEALGSLRTQTRHMIGEVQHHKRRVIREATTVTLGRRASREYAAVAIDY